eukprot:995688-Amphidinium_carterae.2
MQKCQLTRVFGGIGNHFQTVDPKSSYIAPLPSHQHNEPGKVGNKPRTPVRQYFGVCQLGPGLPFAQAHMLS